MLGSVSFIGAGIMAEAMIQGLISNSIAEKGSLMASEPDEKRRTYIKEKYGIKTSPSNHEALAFGDTIVLSVKPQVLPKLLSELKGNLRETQLLISIVTGGRLLALCEGLSHKAVVRAIPNTPAQIGEGMTVWTSTPEVAPAQLSQARDMFLALGREIRLEDEKYLDMATAVSGSGPAYVFLILEALIDAAVHIGFQRDLAKVLVLETMKGSVLFAEKTGKHPAELRNMVTSPGGTTAEALFHMEKGSLRALLDDAVSAAYRKAQALGGTSEKPKG